jgi:hypothetical protein
MQNRPAPRIAPREIVARAVFQPAGSHQLEIAVPSGVVSMVFEEDMIPQIERAIASFREKVAFEEGRGGVQFQKSIPLETR